MAVLLCFGTLTVAHGKGVTDPATVKDNGSPYYIMVNRAACVVTVYTLDSAGYYSVPLRAMLCSVGEEGNTPLGTYAVTYFKTRWLHMVDDSYGQYNTQFYGNFLFHSVCYSDKSEDTLFTEEYNDLGNAVSQGCIRLQTADAKWIYDNCPTGTTVVIYDDAENAGALGTPDKALDYLDPNSPNANWEPTDPDKDNPWRGQTVTEISLPTDTAELTVGDRLTLEPQFAPAELTPTLRYHSSNPTVASVDERGNVIAHSEGTARVSVSAGSYYAHMTVTVSGKALCFSDVPAGAWYYDDVRYIYENGIMSGSDGLFLPREPLNRIMGLQILFNLSEDSETTAQEPWYAPALSWAMNNGMCQGMSTTPNALLKPLSRSDLIVLLYRFEVLSGQGTPLSDGDLNRFTDREDINSFAEEALSWAVGRSILNGDDTGCLRPNDMVTRAEAAHILRLYLENRPMG